jgi:hypothetical protein
MSGVGTACCSSTCSLRFSRATGALQNHRSHHDLRFREHFTSASSTSTGWVLLLVYIIRTTSARLSTPVQAPVPCKLQSTNKYGRWDKQFSQVSMRTLLSTAECITTILTQQLVLPKYSRFHYGRLVPNIQVRASHPCHRCTMTYAHS